MIDIDKSNEISGILSTLYAHMRKMANTNAGSRGNDYGENVAKIGTRSHSIATLFTEYKKVAGYKQFDFIIATPIVDLLTAFKMSYDEVRLSCSKFKC